MASNSGYGARNRKLRAHILSHRHKPETVNRKWDEAGDSQSLTPVCTSFNKATPPVSLKRDHSLGSKYPNGYGTFLFHTAIGYLPLSPATLVFETVSY